jgi:hypothetical protein
LVVRIAGVSVLHANLNSLIGNLNHLYTILHFFLKNSMGKYSRTWRVYGTNDVAVTAPLERNYTVALALKRWTGFPTIRGVRTCNCHLLAFPHDNVTIFCTTSEDTTFWVVWNAVDFVLIELSLKCGFSQSEYVVFIWCDTEHTNHVLSWDCGHKTLACPDGVEELRVSSDCKFNFSVWYKFFS